MNPFRRKNRNAESQAQGVTESDKNIPKPFTLKTESASTVELVASQSDAAVKQTTLASDNGKVRPEYKLRDDPTYPSIPLTKQTVVDGVATVVANTTDTASDLRGEQAVVEQEAPVAAPLNQPAPPSRLQAPPPAVDGVETVGFSATARPKRISADIKPVISVRDVKKIYQMGDIEVRALRGIDLDIYPGEILAIMGPSGSGKSTLMNVLGCLDVPSEGTYLLDGVDVRQLSDNQLASIRSKKIGFVFQSYNLLSRTSAVANVELPLLYSGSSGRERRRRAKESLDLVGLGDRLDHRPNELSGGQQQRVAIARALINRPAMILADEPTGNLDSKTRVEIMKLFQRLNRDQGITIVFVTHDPETADYCERVVWIRDGVIARDDRHPIRAGIYAEDNGANGAPIHRPLTAPPPPVGSPTATEGIAPAAHPSLAELEAKVAEMKLAEAKAIEAKAAEQTKYELPIL